MKLAVRRDPVDRHRLVLGLRILVSRVFELKLKHLAFRAPTSINFYRFTARVILKIMPGAPIA